MLGSPSIVPEWAGRLLCLPRFHLATALKELRCPSSSIPSRHGEGSPGVSFISRKRYTPCQGQTAIFLRESGGRAAHGAWRLAAGGEEVEYLLDDELGRLAHHEVANRRDPFEGQFRKVFG